MSDPFHLERVLKASFKANSKLLLPVWGCADEPLFRGAFESFHTSLKLTLSIRSICWTSKRIDQVCQQQVAVTSSNLAIFSSASGSSACLARFPWNPSPNKPPANPAPGSFPDLFLLDIHQTNRLHLLSWFLFHRANLREILNGLGFKGEGQENDKKWKWNNSAFSVGS